MKQDRIDFIFSNLMTAKQSNSELDSRIRDILLKFDELSEETGQDLLDKEWVETSLFDDYSNIDLVYFLQESGLSPLYSRASRYLSFIIKTSDIEPSLKEVGNVDFI